LAEYGPVKYKSEEKLKTSADSKTTSYVPILDVFYILVHLSLYLCLSL